LVPFNNPCPVIHRISNLLPIIEARIGSTSLLKLIKRKDALALVTTLRPRFGRESPS